MTASLPFPVMGKIKPVSVARFWFCFLALLCAAACRAQPQERGVSRPRVVLVLCDALTLDDLLSPANPHLAHLAETGALGVMNCAVAGPKTPAAATLILAAGAHVPAAPTDEMAANVWEAVPGERGDAGAVYARRVGPLEAPLLPMRPADIRHLGLAPLARRGLDSERLGAALAAANPPIRADVYGNADAAVWGRRAALLTVDGRGVGAGYVAPLRAHSQSPFGLADDPIRLTQAVLESEADVSVVQLGDTARAEAARPSLSPDAYGAARAAALRRLDLFLYLLTAKMQAEGRQADVLLVAPRPPSGQAGIPSVWNRLTPVLALGPHFPPGLLTSATTRTPGLIANVDIAPTLLALFRAPVPVMMIGRPVRSVAYAENGALRVAAVARLDYLATLNGCAVVPVMAPIAVACVLVVVGSLIARRRGGVRASRWLGPGVVFFLNLPAALMLAPLLVPPTLLEYGLRIAAWMAGLTAFSYLLARALRVGPPAAAALLGVLLVAGDTLLGQPLLKDSLLSSYPLSGIRYYGIGNEYLGIVMGFALMGAFAALDDRGLRFPPDGDGRGLRLALAVGWLALLLLLGWPGLGANAGSLAATGAGFGLGAAILHGRRPTVRLGLLCILAGLLLAFVFGALDAAFAGQGASSHFGGALRAASAGRGAGYLAEIALRKVGMNLRLLVSLWVLLGLGGVAVAALAVRRLGGESLRAVLAQRPWTARGLMAALAAALASLVFKDSGVVTVIFLVSAVFLFLLYALLTDPLPG